MNQCKYDLLFSAYCESTETVLEHISADVSVYDIERVVLQGSEGYVTVDSGDTFGFHIAGSDVTVFSVRLWTQFADHITVKLLRGKDVYPPVDVSVVINLIKNINESQN